MEGGAYNEIHDGVEVRGELIAVGLQQRNGAWLMMTSINSFIRHSHGKYEWRGDKRSRNRCYVQCQVYSFWKHRSRIETRSEYRT